MTAKSNPTCQLRTAAEADIPRIREFAAETWNRCYPGIISHEQIGYMLGWMYAPQKLAAEMAGDIWFGLILAESQEIGYVSFGPGEESGEAHLHKFYLHPDWHGKGLGSAALREILTLAQHHGYVTMSLRVNRANESAIRCYRNAGFELKREICDDIGGGFVMDDFWMARHL